MQMDLAVAKLRADTSDPAHQEVLSLSLSLSLSASLSLCLSHYPERGFPVREALSYERGTPAIFDFWVVNHKWVC